MGLSEQLEENTKDGQEHCVIRCDDMLELLRCWDNVKRDFHNMEGKVARLTGELQAYRILDAAGRINRE